MAISQITQEMVDRAILQVFSNFDSPVAPSSKGQDLFMKGYTNEFIQFLRNDILKVNLQEIKEDIQQMKESIPNWKIVIVGNSSPLEQTLVKDENFTVI